MTSAYGANEELVGNATCVVQSCVFPANVQPDLHLYLTVTSRSHSWLVTLLRTFCGLAEIHSRGPPPGEQNYSTHKKGGAETAMNAPLDPLIH